VFVLYFHRCMVEMLGTAPRSEKSGTLHLGDNHPAYAAQLVDTCSSPL